MNAGFREAVKEWYAELACKPMPEACETPMIKVKIVEEEGFEEDSGDPAKPVNVLDDPDQLWTEDDWNGDKEKEALGRIDKQGPDAPKFWTNKYIDKAPQYWKAFYNRNKDNFYKDRHYLHIVFPDLAPAPAPEEGEREKADTRILPPLRLLEVGCGVGNAVFPLIEINPRLHAHAFDCASSAVDLVHEHIASAALGDRLSASVCDLVREEAPVPPGSMDFVLCMYVLSAIAPSAHADCFRKLTGTLKPGGRLLLRDYALYDEAQLRFNKGSKLFDNFYVRQDGTCAYYFSTEDMERLAVSSGMKIVENYYIRRQYANRAKKQARYRIWLHAILEKL